MKQISTELAAHIASETTTLATCWKLTRKDAVSMGFTDHDQNLTIDGLEYKATSGFNPSSIISNANLAVDTQDVEGMLASESITEADIFAGKYDSAEIEVFMVNYEDLSQGKLKLKKGWLGEVSIKSQQFYAEIRGLSQKLSQTVGQLYSPSCRATLGDAHCGVNLATHQFAGQVSVANSRNRFHSTDLTESGGDFTGGTVMFTSGQNEGIGMEIKEHQYNVITGAEISLALPMPYDIAGTDAFTITRGCDKRLTTCKAKFNNVINFRGEPHVPGLDKIFETAGTRSGA